MQQRCMASVVYQTVVLYGTSLGYLSARPCCGILSALQRIAAFQTGAETLGVYLKIENTSPPVRFTEQIKLVSLITAPCMVALAHV